MKSILLAASLLASTVLKAQDFSEYLKKGIEMMLAEDYKEAFYNFSKAHEYNPTDVETHYYLGEVKFKLGNAKGSMDSYNKAIELEPKYYKAFKGRGKLKASLKDYRGSISDFNIAIEIKPDFSNAYFDRGLSYFNVKKYKEAIDDFSKVIEFNPKDAEAYYARGNAKMKSGDINGGCMDWSKAGESGYIKVYELIRQNCN